MLATITGEQLDAALNDALARVHEYDDVEDKLAIFGLDSEGVRLLLEERWSVYAAEPHDNAELFVRGFAEGLLTGLQLGMS